MFKFKIKEKDFFYRENQFIQYLTKSVHHSTDLALLLDNSASSRQIAVVFDQKYIAVSTYPQNFYQRLLSSLYVHFKKGLN